MNKELVLYSNNEFYDYVLHYICSEENLSEKVNSFCYLEESNLRSYEYKPRFHKGDNKEKKVKICSLEDTSFSFEWDGKQIYFNLETFEENNTPKLITIAPCNSCTAEQII